MLELFFSGVAIGSIYSILALGFVLIFKCTKVFNFAQGTLVLVGTYLSYTLIMDAGLPAPLALLISMATGFVLGFVIERLLLRPMIGEPVLSVLLLTIGLSEIIKAILGLIWGAWPRPFPPIFPGGSISLFGQNIPQVYLWATVTSLGVFVLFILFYRQSTLGISMRAVATNQDYASLMGISVSRVFALSWGFAALVGAVGGVFLASMLSVNLNLDIFAFRAFPGAVLGGMDSVGGALLGGLAIGIIENLAGRFIDPLLGGGAKEVIAFVVMLAVLLVKPYGLFGTEEIERL